jgi:hypothetical protein
VGGLGLGLDFCGRADFLGLSFLGFSPEADASPLAEMSAELAAASSSAKERLAEADSSSAADAGTAGSISAEAGS